LKRHHRGDILEQIRWDQVSVLMADTMNVCVRISKKDTEAEVEIDEDCGFLVHDTFFVL